MLIILVYPLFIPIKMGCGGNNIGVSCNYNSYHDFDINQCKVVTHYSLLMPNTDLGGCKE